MTAKIVKDAWIKGAGTQCQIRPPQAAHPWRLVLLGPPGVGKGTQADLLSRGLAACHLSTGEVFRASNALPATQLAPALASALQLMRKGELVPDSVVLGIIRERLDCLHCGGGFLLDGFPRTAPQAEALEQLLKDEGISLDAVVNYEIALDEIVERLAGRLTCSKCSTPFHRASRPPRVAGVCDLCQSPLVQREDDRPESVRARLQAYLKTAQPLIDFYRKRELLVSVPSQGSPEEIWQRTMSALKAKSDGKTPRGRA